MGNILGSRTSERICRKRRAKGRICLLSVARGCHRNEFSYSVHRKLSRPYYKLIADFKENEIEKDPVISDVRPLALWDGPKQTAFRLFPFPWQQNKWRGAVLHVDHGNQAAFLSSYVDSISPRIWKNDLLGYTDYELVPQEKESAALGQKIRNAFVILKAA